MTVDPTERARHLVDRYVGPRLDAFGDLPGVRQAVEDLTATAAAEIDFERLLDRQADQLLGPGSNAMPDAYLVGEAAAEDALQRAAAGLRSAMAQTGVMVDPWEFERAAATALGDDPTLSIRSELARTPRADMRPAILQWSLAPAPWAADTDANDGGRPVVGPELPGGSSALARVDGGPHDGWVQIGLIERHATPAHRSPRRPGRSRTIMLGLELADGPSAPGTVPFTPGFWQTWLFRLPIEPGAEPARLRQDMAFGVSPLVGLIAAGMDGVPEEHTGAGLPPFVLAPIPALTAMLDVRPSPGVCGLSLGDARGAGIVGRHWRGHLVHDGNYKPLVPAVEGADLLLRPDLFEQVEDAAGEGRLRAPLSVMESRPRPSADDAGHQDDPLG